jgi:pseudouridine-5'-phosphate glycosidase
MHSIPEIQAEVKGALDASAPVLALESALISHSLRYPQNMEMARALEQVVRENGAVPCDACPLT